MALAPGFMTNLISLHLLNVKGVHWNSENPQYLTRSGKVFCNLERVGHHWVFEWNTSGSGFVTQRSKVKRHATFTEAQMHLVLGHASLEVISHIQAAVDDITIDKSDLTPSTIECETYSLSKAIEVVSQQSKVEELENGVPFNRTT